MSLDPLGVEALYTAAGVRARAAGLGAADVVRLALAAYAEAGGQVLKSCEVVKGEITAEFERKTVH